MWKEAGSIRLNAHLLHTDSVSGLAKWGNLARAKSPSRVGMRTASLVEEDRAFTKKSDNVRAEVQSDSRKLSDRSYHKCI